MTIMRQQAEERELIARDVRPDSRKRVTLGAALKGLDDASFNVYRDRRGRIILEPQVSVPASEAWLFRNKRALESVARGLDQIADAKVIGSFGKYSDDEP
ncbi:MAG TPA: hypothetical protein VII32_15765 [Thermoanaerobaculia bacterium]|jgi:hypothetical protein